jgi:hypothetical protein
MAILASYSFKRANPKYVANGVRVPRKLFTFVWGKYTYASGAGNVHGLTIERRGSNERIPQRFYVKQSQLDTHLRPAPIKVCSSGFGRTAILTCQYMHQGKV